MTQKSNTTVAVSAILDAHSQEARELFLDTNVPVLTEITSPLQFYREYVSKNRPVLFKNAVQHWPAIRKWTPEYLREKCGNMEVTVAVTPNGYADGINEDRFVMPEERMMTVEKFLNVIAQPAKYKGVFYIQKQNSNMTDEFATLLDDIDRDIPLGTEAFGKAPDAVNFWIGDERAVTSMHKDHYENLFCVISGRKSFILIPPSDQPYVPYEHYQAAVYKLNGEEFEIIDDEATGKVRWVAIDPLNPDFGTYPQYRKARPVKVEVNTGDMLYLPSLWFHHVQQSHACISVNYWYDMEYDIKYNYFKMVENLTELLHCQQNDEANLIADT